MKGNEMLFEIIGKNLVCGCSFRIIQVKASKFTEKEHLREQKVKRRFKQHKWIKLIQY